MVKMSNAQLISHLDHLVVNASNSLSESQQLLTDIMTDLEEESGISSPEDEATYLQLILEYRLATQDALVSLMSLDKHVLYILGIQPQHSDKVNLERLTYALGSDDLKQILHALSQLVEHLLRIAKRYQTQQKNSVSQKPAKVVKTIKGMKAVILKQTTFLSSIRSLEKDIEQLIRFEATGPIYDHIAAIRGPISQFYQAVLSGLEVSNKLYQLVNKNQLLQDSVDLILKRTDEVLQNMPSLYQPQLHHSLGHFPPKTSNQLEERAAAKRLRPFF